MVILVQEALEQTRTGQNGSVWQATSAVDGVSYVARSRHGAAHELARVLVAAGVRDQPVETRQAGSEVVRMRYRSLHAMARTTYRESASTPLRSVRWEARPGNLAAEPPGEGEKGGESEFPVAE